MDIFNAIIPAENEVNSMETHSEDFFSLRKIFSEDSENEEDLFLAGIAVFRANF